MPKILAVPSQSLSLPEGFSDWDKETLSTVTAALEQTVWLERAEAEVDPTYRQIIPYNVIMTPAIGADNLLLAYKRETGGEKRLRDLWSIGIGGHIEESDKGSDTFETVANCTRRELEEELGLEAAKSLQQKETNILGVLSLSDTPVNRVHLGLVIMHWSPNRFVSSGEETGARFLSCKELNKLFNNLEPWSQHTFVYVLRHYV